MNHDRPKLETRPDMWLLELVVHVLQETTSVNPRLPRITSRENRSTMAGSTVSTTSGGGIHAGSRGGPNHRRCRRQPGPVFSQPAVHSAVGMRGAFVGDVFESVRDLTSSNSCRYCGCTARPCCHCSPRRAHVFGLGTEGLRKRSRFLPCATNIWRVAIPFH